MNYINFIIKLDVLAVVPSSGSEPQEDAKEILPGKGKKSTF